MPTNSVWLNTVDYSPLELTLFLVGCSLWVLVYIIYLSNVIRYSFFEMPLVAAVSNFAWEALWTLCFRTDMGRLCEWLYTAWFVVDLFLIAAALRFAPKQFSSAFGQRMSRYLFVGCILFFFPFYYFFTQQGLDTSIGARSAYMCQTILSGAYLLFIVQRRSRAGFSSAVGWLRTYATGVISVMMVLHYPDDRWLHLLCATSFVLDHLYLWAFHQLTQPCTNAERIAPARLEQV